MQITKVPKNNFCVTRFIILNTLPNSLGSLKMELKDKWDHLQKKKLVLQESKKQPLADR